MKSRVPVTPGSPGAVCSVLLGKPGPPKLPSSFSISITLETASRMLAIEKLPFRSL